MSEPGTDEADFIADAEAHNGWWYDDAAAVELLATVTDLKPRSDLHRLLWTIDGERSAETNNLIYPMYGPTGIGKSTLLVQFIAAIMRDDSLDFSRGADDYDIIDAVDPRQILYVPLEASLYHLERPAEAITRLGEVIDYFRSHVASRDRRQYIILDDIGALDLHAEARDALVELVDENTYLLLTGVLESQVTVPQAATESVETVRSPFPILPMKFVDTIKQGVYDASALATTDSDLKERIEAYQSRRLDGPSYIKDVKQALGDERDADAAIAALDTLYFGAFSPTERTQLHDAAREYLQRGGLVHSTTDDRIRNDLTRSHFLLYLYKELARYESIQRPENLHRLSSLAASRAGEELRYTDLAEQLEVDRRTVDGYLSVLEDGLSVSESHDYSLQRHRRTRLYLRNPRHVVLLSQRQEHDGFESYDQTGTLNHAFEYKLARTVAFDHATRLAYAVSGGHEKTPAVEYCETDAGTVDYILRGGDFVFPFVLSYHPHTRGAAEIAASFDPAEGKHPNPESDDLLEIEYQSPIRFIITDSLPSAVTDSDSLVLDSEGMRLCYLPYWLFLLIC